MRDADDFPETYEDCTSEEIGKILENRTKFYLYKNQYPLIEHLTLEQKGEILDVIFRFECYGESPDVASLDPSIQGFLYYWLDMESKGLKKYVNSSLKKSKAGRLSHAPADKCRQMPTSAADKKKSRYDIEMPTSAADKKRKDRKEKKRQGMGREESASTPTFENLDEHEKKLIEEATDPKHEPVESIMYIDVFHYCADHDIPPEENPEFSAGEFVEHYKKSDYKTYGKPITDWKPLVYLWIYQKKHQ